mmetsp:Transcript_23157/g.41005  ORF Transcript_23157/g.41005 Transcript_23157/m.41005 type:complete len:317 (-) Transcript_23157:293-1243(-)
MSGNTSLWIEALMWTELKRQGLEPQEVPQAQKNRLLSLSLQLLGAGTIRTKLLDQMTLKMEMMREIEVTSGADRAGRFAENCHRLENLGCIQEKERVSLLQLLRQLSRSRSQVYGSVVPASTSSASSSAGAVGATVGMSPLSGGLSSLVPSATSADASLSSHLFGGSSGRSFPTSLLSHSPLPPSSSVFASSSSALASASAATPLPASPSLPADIMNGIQGVQDFLATEPLLVQDLLYAAQGIEGRLLRWSATRLDAASEVVLGDGLGSVGGGGRSGVGGCDGDDDDGDGDGDGTSVVIGVVIGVANERDAADDGS